MITKGELLTPRISLHCKVARTDWKGGNVTDVLVAGWRVRLVLTRRGRRGRQGGVRGQGEQVPAANHQLPASQTFYPHLFNSCLNAILTTTFLTLPPFDEISEIIDQIILQLCRKNCSHFFCMSEMLTDFCSLLVQLLAKMNHSKGHDVSTRKVCYQI